MLKNIVKKGAVVALACTITFTAVGCGKTDSNAIVIVNGQAVPMERFDKNYEMVKNMYESQMGEDILNQKVGEEGLTLKDQVIDEIISQIVTEQVIMQDAEKRGIKVEDKEIDETMKNYVEMVGGEESFKGYLTANGIDEKDFKEDVKKMLLASKQKEAVLKDIKVSEQEAKKYFEEHKDELGEVHAKHILIKVEQTDAKQAEEAKAKAEAILAEVKNGGNFDEIAKTKSEDPGSAAKGGDLGYFGRGQMVKEFEDAAFALKKGEISDLVKSDFGYHIIKVEDKKVEFKDLKADIENALKEDKYVEEMKKLEKEAKIETFKDNIQIKEDKKEDKKDDKKDDKVEDKKEEKKN